MPSESHALIVIDMSTEQLYPNGVPFLKDWKGYSNILELAKQFPAKRVFDSRLWISPEDNSSLSKLYPDVGHANSEGAKLCKNLSQLQAKFVKKVQYSSFYGSNLHEMLQTEGVKVILLTGINTDWCIFATALDAFYLGYEVWLIQDACGSICGKSGHKNGISEFQKFLGCRGKVLDTLQALKMLHKCKTWI